MGNPFNMTRGQAMMLYLLVGSGGSRYVHHPLETVSLRILYQKVIVRLRMKPFIRLM